MKGVPGWRGSELLKLLIKGQISLIIDEDAGVVKNSALHAIHQYMHRDIFASIESQIRREAL